MEFKNVAGVDRDSLQDEEEDKQLCDSCRKTDSDKKTLAERYCIKCEKKLCILCVKEHTNKEGHLVVALNEQNGTKKFKVSDACFLHEADLVELYCACCRKVICSDWERSSHSSHNCSRVEVAAEVISKQTEAEYENLLDIQYHFEKEREKLFNERLNVIKTTKEMQTQIRKQCDEITELVCNETRALLIELDVLQKERLEEIEVEGRKMEEHAFAFEKFKEYCDQIKRNSNPRQTCESVSVLRNIADDLKTRPEGLWKSKLLPVQFSIQKADISQVLSALGKLTIKCPLKMTESTAAVALTEKDVCGMTSLHDKLYVLSKSISIRRNEPPFTSVGEITSLELLTPKAIVSCSKASCLYVYDSGADCVWKVTIPDHRVIRWFDKVEQPTSMSVTPNAELLILRNKKPVSLEVYNQHAILLRRLSLPATIPSLSSVDETPSGWYIGLGGQSVLKFRRNGSIISVMPFDDPKYQGSPQCYNLSPYHVFVQCSTYGSTSFEHRGTLSSLTLDLTNPQILVGKSCRWIKPVASCYLKKAMQLFVLEERVSLKYKTWYIKAYHVFSE